MNRLRIVANSFSWHVCMRAVKLIFAFTTVMTQIWFVFIIIYEKKGILFLQCPKFLISAESIILFDELLRVFRIYVYTVKCLNYSLADTSHYRWCMMISLYLKRPCLRSLTLWFIFANTNSQAAPIVVLWQMFGVIHKTWARAFELSLRYMWFWSCFLCCFLFHW